MNETLSQPDIPGASENQAKSSGPEEVRWVTVAQTFGITQATIIVGRLRAEGVPARAWQEGAGQATGLIIGELGAGHVVVPEAFEAQALEILAEAPDESLWDEEE
ncbi:MAG: DUF2007 domain-containing protein [Anaerolineales bacterium]|nr:DUF2007 domain-containing protein [Anaerolineales bacterium]